MTAPANHKHIMVDIETMGKGPSAAILSIGAVPFSLHPDRIEVGRAETWFHERATLASNADLGRNIDPETIEWWIGQSKEAQRALLAQPRHDLPVILEGFRRWMVDSPGIRAETIWAKPPHFDVSILMHAFEQANIDWPLHFGATRDVRTVLEIAKGLGWNDVVRLDLWGEKHNALDDATYQASQVCLFYDKLRKQHGNLDQAHL